MIPKARADLAYFYCPTHLEFGDSNLEDLWNLMIGILDGKIRNVKQVAKVLEDFGQAYYAAQDPPVPFEVEVVENYPYFLQGYLYLVCPDLPEEHRHTFFRFKRIGRKYR